MIKNPRNENTMTPADFRTLALAQDGAVERAHMNHPDFRIAGKIFASLGVPDAAWGMVKVTPEQQRALLTSAPEAFSPASGAWGAQGCTRVLLAKAKKPAVRGALAQAAEIARARAGAKGRTLKERFGSKP